MDYDFTYTGAEIQAILDTAKKLKDSGFIFLGVATPSTNPGTPDQNVAYFASKGGTYTNFNNIELNDGISLLMWNGIWNSQTFFSVDSKPTTNSSNLVQSGGAHKFSTFSVQPIDTGIVSDCLKTDGTIYNVHDSNNYVYTYMIHPNGVYNAKGRTVPGAQFCGIAYYDENETFISYEEQGVEGSGIMFDCVLTIPNNAKYVKIQGNSYFTLPILYGTVSSLYEEFNESTYPIVTLEYIQIKNNAVIDKRDGSIQSAGSVNWNTATYLITDNSYLIAMGRVGVNSGTIQGCSIAYYDYQNQFIGYEKEWGNTAEDFSNFVLTIPSGARYVKVSGRFAQGPRLDLKGSVRYDTEELLKLINQNIANTLNGKTVAIIGDSISTHGNSGEDANTVEMIIGSDDVGKTLSAYVTYEDVQAGLSLGGTTFTTSDIGNEVTFIPISEDIGKVIGLPKNYNANTLDVWWTYVRDKFDCNILPVCWSGSGLTRNRISSDEYKASYSWHESQIRKCGIRIEGTMNRTAPDVIIITRGGNDFSHSPYAMLTDGYFDNYNVQYPDTDIRQDGEYGFKEAYFMTIGKLREAYPFAKIVLCTYPVMKRINYSHFPMNNGYYSEPQYNNAVREIADFCGCDVIEFDKCGITWENMYPTYISDSATTPVHPNAEGHEVMGKCAIEALKNINFDL